MNQDVLSELLGLSAPAIAIAFTGHLGVIVNSLRTIINANIALEQFHRKRAAI